MLRLTNPLVLGMTCSVAVHSSRNEDPANQIQQLLKNYDVLQAKVRKLEAQNENQESQIVALQNQQSARLTADEPKEVYNQADRQTITKMPTSCQDLKVIGHTNSGFYSVNETNGLTSVYCDFKAPATGFQTLIGYNDVKTAPVYFSVTQGSSFSLKDPNVVTFDAASLNLGGAINIATGMFKAPKPGRYFFTASGVVQYDGGTSVGSSGVFGLTFMGLSVNSKSTCVSVATASTMPQYQPINLQCTVNLKAGDWVFLSGQINSNYKASIYATSNFPFSFMGWLIEEDIALNK